MRIDLIQIGYEVSLSLRNLIHYARLDGEIASAVDFRLHELRMQTFERPRRFANQFSPFNEWERLLGELCEARPAVVGLSCFLWNREVSIQFANHLKVLLPETLLVLGGPEVSQVADLIMQRHRRVDIVVRGEGEATFQELVQRLLQGRDPTDLPGASCRLPDGSVVHNPPRPQLASLDQIPPPYDEEVARRDTALRRFEDFVIYETMRGCPFDCGFCLYGGGSTKVRYYSVERAVADMLVCLKDGLKIQIIDSTFGLRRKRSRALLQGLAAAQPYTGKITVEAQAEYIDDELADLLAAAGASQVGMGLQTVSSEAVDLMQRQFDQDRFRAALARLARRDVYHYVDIIFGMPGDTWQGYLETIDFALTLRHTDVQFHRLLVLPGTRYWREADQLGLKHADDPPYEVLATPTYSHRDLIRSHKLAFVYHLLHYAMGGGAPVARLLSASKMKPAAFLIDLAAYLENHGIVLTVSPYNIGEISFAIHQVLSDYLKARGLQHAVSLNQ